MTNNDHQTDKTEVDGHTGVETTGHEWDGIKELNNPLPRWWLIVFYATIAWAVAYCIFMPSFPGFPGLRKYSDRDKVAEEIALASNERSELANRLLSDLSLEAIEQDPELFQFVMAAGKSAFGDNCATCHGVGGRGFSGYPSLADDVWLWGGTLEDIKYTITHGIRSHSEQTRFSSMPAYGEQKILSPRDIDNLAVYVKSLSEDVDNPEAIEAARPIFEAQCATCHGKDGRGNREFGAPNLTDAEWLYGGDLRSIRAQIHSGRNGVMPAWGDRLDDATITALAVYVHALGGGEQDYARIDDQETEDAAGGK
ncbi:cytochrome-c oxidase, cbb3-type subunit III [Parvularcula lutaonensis]|uniref:Cbb3-type cytochrome c oxidase subunit n=1 Tax=Parvularcula lutaonensis TaxID=491923 RepID=A0ABV7MAA2_9PROT|nr:cytochrome-c oxidase, cbb3-type subunit III [Parvularcula lutaonensis]GGY45549.1 Cbb3-type cytochrome c oxidase subunit [Parvularcula lutaonensis]